MKRFFFLLPFICFLSLNLDAQMALGLETGLNQSSTRYSGLDGYDAKIRTDYFVGLAPSVAIRENVRAGVGIQYSRKGFILNPPNSTDDLEYRISYLDILPEVVYSLHPNLALGLGVNVGFLINEEQNRTGEEWIQTKELSLIQSTDFGLTGKIQGQYKRFYAFLRYNHGLKNISNVTFVDDNGNDLSNAKQFNTNLQLGVGYRIGIEICKID
jgi:hypothetical protein